MTRWFLVLALLLASSPALGQGAAPSAAPSTAPPKEVHAIGGLQTDLKNEDAIRKVYADYTAAWNRHDVKAMTAFWAIDGDYMEPDGHHAKGQTDVEKLFTQEHASVFKDSKLTLTIETVWFISEDVALVDGTYDLVGVHDLNGKDVPARAGHLSALLIYEDGRWKVAASRAMIPVPLSYREK